MKQAKVQDICEEIVDNVEGALGCALVDLGTGLPMALDVKPGSLVDAAAMELMSAAGVTYFRAYAGKPIEAGDDSGNVVEEIQATTAETYHFMSLVPGEDQQLLILISERGSSNLALGWMAMRQALGMIQSASANGTDASGDPPAGVASPAYVSPQPSVQPQPTSGFASNRARSRRTIWGQR